MSKIIQVEMRESDRKTRRERILVKRPYSPPTIEPHPIDWDVKLPLIEKCFGLRLKT